MSIDDLTPEQQEKVSEYSRELSAEQLDGVSGGVKAYDDDSRKRKKKDDPNNE